MSELPKCSFCNWTNVRLLNIEEPNGNPVYICQGCTKRELTQLHQQLEAAKGYWNLKIDAENKAKELRQQNEQLGQDLDDAFSRLDSASIQNEQLVKERAAIEAFLAKEFVNNPHGTNERTGDLLDEFTAWVEHHATVEKQRDELVDKIWETRWVSEEQDYQDLVARAAELRSERTKL